MLNTTNEKHINTSILKIYNFSGMGNYSHCFGWDDGLSCVLQESTTFESALESEEWLRGYNGCSYSLLETVKKGVFYDMNSHGGTRNVDGFVIANSRRDARKLLKDFETGFEIIEYREKLKHYIMKKHKLQVDKLYEHDCHNCVFLGVFQSHDLYYCNSSNPTVIARFGIDGDYCSGLNFAKPGGIPVLVEAKKRAIKKGLINEQ